MKRLIAIALAFCLLLGGCLSVNTIGLTAEQKNEDFEYLCTLLDDLFPFWGEYEMLGVNREKRYKDYCEKVEAAKTDIEFMNVLEYFFVKITSKGNLGHLALLNGYWYDWYGMYQTAEGMEPWKELLSNEKTAESYAMLDKTKQTGFAKKSPFET